MEELLNKVKQNLILDHAVDDVLIQSYITAAVSYAESFRISPSWDVLETLRICHPPPNRRSSCWPPTFTNPEMDLRAVFLLTAFRQENRCGTR